MPFPPRRGLWSGRSRARLPVLRGKYPGAVCAGRGKHHCSGTVRSSRGCGKALSVRPLALRAGRPAWKGRTKFDVLQCQLSDTDRVATVYV